VRASRAVADAYLGALHEAPPVAEAWA
jgi:hypothetical protein